MWMGCSCVGASLEMVEVILMLLLLLGQGFYNEVSTYLIGKIRKQKLKSTSFLFTNWNRRSLW